VLRLKVDNIGQDRAEVAEQLRELADKRGVNFSLEDSRRRTSLAWVRSVPESGVTTTTRRGGKRHRQILERLGYGDGAWRRAFVSGLIFLRFSPLMVFRRSTGWRALT
jgi:hypothetical protein